MRGIGAGAFECGNEPSGFRKMRGISWLSVELLASQQELSYMGSVKGLNRRNAWSLYGVRMQCALMRIFYTMYCPPGCWKGQVANLCLCRLARYPDRLFFFFPLSVRAGVRNVVFPWWVHLPSSPKSLPKHSMPHTFFIGRLVIAEDERSFPKNLWISSKMWHRLTVKHFSFDLARSSVWFSSCRPSTVISEFLQFLLVPPG